MPQLLADAPRPHRVSRPGHHLRGLRTHVPGRRRGPAAPSANATPIGPSESAPTAQRAAPSQATTLDDRIARVSRELVIEDILAAQLRKANREVIYLRAQLADLRGQLEGARGELAQVTRLRKELEAARINSRQPEVLPRRPPDVTAEVVQLSDQLQAAGAEIQQLRGDLQAVKAARSELDALRQQRSALAAGHEKHVAGLTAELDALLLPTSRPRRAAARRRGPRTTSAAGPTTWSGRWRRPPRARPSARRCTPRRPRSSGAGWKGSAAAGRSTPPPPGGRSRRPGGTGARPPGMGSAPPGGCRRPRAAAERGADPRPPRHSASGSSGTPKRSAGWPRSCAALPAEVERIHKEWQAPPGRRSRTRAAPSARSRRGPPDRSACGKMPRPGRAPPGRRARRLHQRFEQLRAEAEALRGERDRHAADCDDALASWARSKAPRGPKSPA